VKRRTSVTLDPDLVEEAQRLTGEESPSRAVERVLPGCVRRIQARGILSLAGSGLWEGDLGEMRRDS
jgi:Arc/MetJ family transcription regulator